MITRYQGQSRQSDERIPSPASKPWKTGNDIGLVSPFYDELLCCVSQAMFKIIPGYPFLQLGSIYSFDALLCDPGSSG